VVAPAGAVRTKPRALNIALAQCRGTIVGVYDAEDAPDPDQLMRVAARFAVAPSDVACLQGVLDFYNARAKAMARAFALEYAGWFRLVLPGLQRLRLVLPLGGTTLFFRRPVLEALGAWDAHNVTEDADLGLRLARHGWRTEMLDSVTLEEANCSPLPWVKQRSRWIKGYLMTWAVHMRDPVALWRALGTRRFLAVQVQFALTVAQALLAPCLWAFWLVGSGGALPLLPPLPPAVASVFPGLLVMSFALDLSIALVAHRRAGLRFGRGWVLVLPLYHALATAAAYKALFDMALRPFHWDKTRHGGFGG
jgi:cellulose synthase/poly-beta-1,6-N-acetylglucosamine synthase-like glycosyltransferase